MDSSNKLGTIDSGRLFDELAGSETDEDGMETLESKLADQWPVPETVEEDLMDNNNNSCRDEVYLNDEDSICTDEILTPVSVDGGSPQQFPPELSINDDRAFSPYFVKEGTRTELHYLRLRFLNQSQWHVVAWGRLFHCTILIRDIQLPVGCAKDVFAEEDEHFVFMRRDCNVDTHSERNKQPMGFTTADGANAEYYLKTSGATSESEIIITDVKVRSLKDICSDRVSTLVNNSLSAVNQLPLSPPVLEHMEHTINNSTFARAKRLIDAWYVWRNHRDESD